ncbi:MAG: B12-binding domain-containing radical SAM protein [Deltaproteobacteria bacterium RIFOXYD12_FULL_50_9]|nr:MAG: B12-binding domain-containing radical SAM protein [Deltaproteobacteria bacterium RIFOXYD12_FULL_50_9]
MKILLVNPPNSGRSIPEERYGIDSIKQILKGEPLALEMLAGNLIGHDVRIVDLKVEPDTLDRVLAEFPPDVVGLTGVTCEANSVLALAGRIKKISGAITVVGGIHASNDPEFFNQPQVDYIVMGLGKLSFRQLLDTVQSNPGATTTIPGIAKSTPGKPLEFIPRQYKREDLVDIAAPRYDLVEQYRDSYTLVTLGIRMGFVATAFGCPFNCSFCCIRPLTNGRYLTQEIDSVIRDIKLLRDIPVIRLLDANTFGDPEHSRRLCHAIKEAGIKKQYLADVRSDTVVRHPDLIREWKETGLRAVIIGFEEISDEELQKLNKANKASTNTEAIRILHDLGITIIGDFIISPDYDETRFDQLSDYIRKNAIDLPMPTVLTPLPGTSLYKTLKDRIVINDLDYYTLTNSVIPTRLDEQRFYLRYAEILKEGHTGARL